MSAPKVLYISPNRIGDSVIASGIVREIGRQRPGARITVISSGPAAPFYRSAPGVERVVAIDKGPKAIHWRRIWAEARAQGWDLVIDTRGSITAWLVRARERRVYSRKLESGAPKVEVIGRLMGLDHALEPELFIDDGARADAARVMGEDDRPVLALAPIAVQAGKSWPPERWAALVEALKDERAFDGWRFMLVGGPAPGDRIAATPALQAAGERAVDFVGQGDILASAAAISRASLFVGNDSGLMHVAAATGTPTLGLFGPTEWWLYGPRGPRTAIVAANPERGTRAPIEDLTVERVAEAVLRLKAEHAV